MKKLIDLGGFTLVLGVRSTIRSRACKNAWPWQGWRVILNGRGCIRKKTTSKSSNLSFCEPTHSYRNQKCPQNSGAQSSSKRFQEHLRTGNVIYTGVFMCPSPSTIPNKPPVSSHHNFRIYFFPGGCLMRKLLQWCMVIWKTYEIQLWFTVCDRDL